MKLRTASSGRTSRIAPEMAERSIPYSSASAAYGIPSLRWTSVTSKGPRPASHTTMPSDGSAEG